MNVNKLANVNLQYFQKFIVETFGKAQSEPDLAVISYATFLSILSREGIVDLTQLMAIADNIAADFEAQDRKAYGAVKMLVDNDLKK
jgi:hypothetical protein